MPRLAIVISAVGSIESLESTLVSVLENRPTDCEIVVALNGPYADPYDLKDEVRLIPAAPHASAVASVNRALSLTRAPFVHLLSSGCTVSEGWTELPLARFGDRQVGSVAPLVVDAEQPQRIFAAGLGYHPSGRRFLVGRGRTQLAHEQAAALVGPCGFAGFYRKAALELVGGLCPHLGLRQADVDLALTLAKAGFTFVSEPQSRVCATSNVDINTEAAALRALHDERLFWRNLLTQGRTSAIARHAGWVALELVASFPRPRLLTQAAARAWACCQLGSYARHRRELAALVQPPARTKVGHEMRVDRPHHAPTHSTGTPARVRSH